MKNYKKSNRGGFKLEEFVAGILSEILEDKTIRPTRGSGNGHEIGDISNPYFYIECKQRTTKDITVKKDTWDKLCSEIPLSSKKLPLYILENKNEDKYVVLNLSDFAGILKKLHNEGVI